MTRETYYHCSVLYYCSSLLESALGRHANGVDPAVGVLEKRYWRDDLCGVHPNTTHQDDENIIHQEENQRPLLLSLCGCGECPSPVYS